MTRVERAAERLFVAALGALALYLAWGSRHWPLIHDAPIMHYIAWLIGQGAAPYRNAFDMNPPGPYLIHLALLRTLGGGDVAWRTFDLAWLALTSAALAAYVRPCGPVPALIAGLLFAVYHLAGGPWLAGQRDFLACPFMLGGAALVASGGGLGRVALAGIAIGAGIAIKPPLVLFLLILAVAASAAAARERRAWWAAGIAVVAGGAVVPLACVAWLAEVGGLSDFLVLQRDYVLPLYTRLARVAPWTALGWWPYGRPVWALLWILVAVAAVTAHLDGRKRLALAGVAFGVVHFVIQGKGWEYHLYPLAAFACLAGGLAVAARERRARWIAMATLGLLVVTLAAKGRQERQPPWIVAKADRVGRLVAALRLRVDAADAVQVLDTGDSGIHALYALGLRQPTRFIYDFPLLHDGDQPIIQRFRAEFIDGVTVAPPRLVVVTERGWPWEGYERHRRFPKLEAWLASAYRLDHEEPGFRVYARRADGAQRAGH